MDTGGKREVGQGGRSIQGREGDEELGKGRQGRKERDL